MKKTILLMLLVLLVVTPCLAKEITSDSLFSIEETQWKLLPTMMVILPFPFLIPPEVFEGPDFELPSWGFYGGKVYDKDNNVIKKSLYVDMVGVSIFLCLTEPDLQEGYTSELIFGMLFPTGMGLITTSQLFGFAIGLVELESAYWIPAG